MKVAFKKTLTGRTQTKRKGQPQGIASTKRFSPWWIAFALKQFAVKIVGVAFSVLRYDVRDYERNVYKKKDLIGL